MHPGEHLWASTIGSITSPGPGLGEPHAPDANPSPAECRRNDCSPILIANHPGQQHASKTKHQQGNEQCAQRTQDKLRACGPGLRGAGRVHPHPHKIGEHGRDKNSYLENGRCLTTWLYRESRCLASICRGAILYSFHARFRCVTMFRGDSRRRCVKSNQGINLDLRMLGNLDLRMLGKYKLSNSGGQLRLTDTGVAGDATEAGAVRVSL